MAYTLLISGIFEDGTMLNPPESYNYYVCAEFDRNNEILIDYETSQKNGIGERYERHRS